MVETFFMSPLEKWCGAKRNFESGGVRAWNQGTHLTTVTVAAVPSLEPWRLPAQGTEVHVSQSPKMVPNGPRMWETLRLINS